MPELVLKMQNKYINVLKTPAATLKKQYVSFSWRRAVMCKRCYQIVCLSETLQLFFLYLKLKAFTMAFNMAT